MSQNELEGRIVAVVVTYAGDIEALRAAGLDTGFDQDGVVSGRIALRDVDRLASAPGVVAIALEPPVHIALDKTVTELRVPWKVPPTDPWPGKGAGVIVAVIDTGIDIFHDSFRKSDGSTRILELWDQAATTGGSAPPAGFQQVGRVYNTNDITNGLAAGPPFASVDTNGHGTHVAGIAAGNGRQDDRCSFPGRYVGVAPEADLVIVRAIALPVGSTPAIRDAMQWCAQAGARHGNKPVVINCSFGTSVGPHDGSGTLDGFVDQILRPVAGPPAGIAIVCSAGNEGDSQIHESGVVAANSPATVSFYVPEGSVRSDNLEIWYTGAASLSITLTAPPNPAVPGSNTVGPIGPGAPGSPFPLGLMTIAVIAPVAPQTNGKKLIDVTISTPASTPPRAVRPGVWQLTLTETAGVAANWDAWFASEKGDSYPTFRLPESGDPPARRRENTIGEPGTSRNAITVASYDDDDGKLAASSSRGTPTVAAGTPVGEFKPTVAAPGVGVAAARSRDDETPSSCCDQKVIDKSGTSMAAPHVTGVVALMLQKNGTLTFEQVRRHLQHATRVDGIPTAEVPPVFDAGANIRAGHLWGSGKVNAAVTLAETAAPGGGGGGGGGMMLMTAPGEGEWGYTPHTIFSRLGDWQSRFGPRPGLMLVASLVSEHLDEVLWLINNNRRVGAVWRRQGGHLLVRHFLHGPPPENAPLPAGVEGCDVAALLQRLLPLLDRFGGPRLRQDLARFDAFARIWPDADLERLDHEALSLAATR